MEVQQFEQAILKMAFETDARITTASVAYYLGIPSQKANDLLETLLEQGVLELDSDDEGNLYYFVPNQGDSSSMDVDSAQTWEQLEAEIDGEPPADAPEADASTAGAPTDETNDDETDDQAPIDSQFVASVDDQGHDEPFSPTEHGPQPGADGQSTGSPPPATPEDSATNSGSFDTYRADDQSGRQTGDDWFRSGDNAGYQSRDTGSNNMYDYGPSARRDSSRSPFEGATSRMGRTDARADSCGDDSIVVENAASCESKPLADSRPTVTSCNEVDSSKFSTHQDYGGFGFTAPNQSTALATTSNSGEMTLAADSHHHIEQPEHQPGMALLLSLILCGTGQIYNGEVSKGIIMLILCFLLWFVFLGWVVHIWSIVDAVVVAERINRKSDSGSQASQPSQAS